MEIRLATQEDALAISKLVHSVSTFFTIHPDGKGAEKFFETITPEAIASYLHADNFRYWVGTNTDQEILAAVALRDNSHLYHLFVRSEEQKKGYARQLWQHVCSYAKANGNQKGITVNSSMVAQSMYQHFGFVASSATQETHGLRYTPMFLSF